METINKCEGMRFGMGVCSLTQEVRGQALVFDEISTGQGGQKVTGQVSKVESQQHLMESLHISVGASVKYGLFSADATMDFVKEHAVDETCITLLLQATVENPPKFMIRPRLTDEANALYLRDPEEFRQIYGDSYIDEIYSGGRFIGLLMFRLHEEKDHQQVSATLDASYGTMFAKGEISVGFQQSIEQVSSQATLEIRVWMDGGSGIQNATDMVGLQKIYADFNGLVARNPVDYRASIKEFRLLPLPAGTLWVEDLVRRSIIERCGQYIIQGITYRRRIEDILLHPEQFENPNLDDLKRKRDEIDAAIPLYANRANACVSAKADTVGSACTLAGIEPIQVAPWPKKIRGDEGLEGKWQEVLRTGSRALPFFPEAFHPKQRHGPPWQYAAGPNEGRYWIFQEPGTENRTGGIFWHPDYGAHIVYGRIFQEYLRRGHCEGPLGYPKTDELSLRDLYPGADPLVRISQFENGLLLWDKQASQLSDTLPASLRDFKQMDMGSTHDSRLLEVLTHLTPLEVKPSDSEASTSDAGGGSGRPFSGG
jgi:hypothetical protein